MQATTKEPWQMTKNEYQKELHMPFDGVRNSSEGGVNYIATPETLIADEVLAHLYDGGSMSDVDATADDIRNDQTTSAAHKRAILAAVELAKQHYANTKGLRGRERSTADGRFKAELNKEFPVERRGDKHKAAVNAAIEAGQAVPADVLADYPDLAAKYAGRQGGR